MKVGDLWKYSSGQVTRTAAASAAIDTTTKIAGWMVKHTYTDISYSSSLAANTLVNVYLWTRNVFMVMPTYGATPAITNFDTKYAGYNDAGIYKIDLSNTSNPCFTPFAFELGDVITSANVYQGTFDVGDRQKVVLADAARSNVIF